MAPDTAATSNGPSPTPEPAELQADLCHANFGAGDTYPNTKRLASGITPPFVFFTCLHRADGVISFQCTGSSHRGGVLTRCSCECHKPEREVRNAD